MIDVLTPGLVWQILCTLVTGGAIYGGIRADLRNMHERIKLANDAALEAHRRIDSHLEKSH